MLRSSSASVSAQISKKCLSFLNRFYGINAEPDDLKQFEREGTREGKKNNWNG